jgi:hypothetical protein
MTSQWTSNREKVRPARTTDTGRGDRSAVQAIDREQSNSQGGRGVSEK